KFLVDLIISVSLIAARFLDRGDERQCDAMQVISASIPLVQALLVLCEVIDWLLAIFYPVCFHSSSFLVRLLPFIGGCIFCTIIVTVLIIVDATTETTPCVSSPTDTAIIFTYDISLTLATICIVALLGLLAIKLNNSLYKPILFHFASTLILLEIPLLVVTVLKYSGHREYVITATHTTNLLVAAHAILHSAFFVCNHEDYRQGIRSTFIKFQILPTV
ncbi:hypothetical protein KIN20_030029, partial [Parelaphostrongylus tenuis]